MSERELIQGCLAQQRLAQHALYEQYKRAMYTLAWRITDDWGLAAEVLRDAFLLVFHHIGAEYQTFAQRDREPEPAISFQRYRFEAISLRYGLQRRLGRFAFVDVSLGAGY